MASSFMVARPVVQARAQRVASRATGRTALRVVAREAAWAPGSEAPAHLTGSMPGDFGFDPLGLGKDPANLAWYQQAELVHARFAMLGVAGVLGPDLAAHVGVSWAGAGVPWYEAGEYTYFATAGSLWAVQVLLMGWAEGRRWVDMKNPGSVNKDPIFGNELPAGAVGYPGGIFDPFGFAKGDIEELKLKEIKNARLAMLAWVGFVVQAQATGMGPIACWKMHLAKIEEHTSELQSP